MNDDYASALKCGGTPDSPSLDVSFIQHYVKIVDAKMFRGYSDRLPLSSSYRH